MTDLLFKLERNIKGRDSSTHSNKNQTHAHTQAHTNKFSKENQEL